MKISSRKTAWPVCVPAYLSRAVQLSSEWVVDKDGRLTEFGQRNARWVSLLPDGEGCPAYVKLRLVHDERELFAELSGAEAVALGRELAARGEEAERRNQPGKGMSGDLPKEGETTLGVGLVGPALLALAETLLDEDRPTDEQQATAAARCLLAHHSRELAATLRSKAGHHDTNTYDYETGPGMHAAAKILDEHADRLDGGNRPKRVDVEQPVTGKSAPCTGTLDH